MSLIRYPFDPNASLSTNKITLEPYEFTATGVHVLVSKNGLFYTDNNCVLKNSATGVDLVEGVDFDWVSIDSDITALTGRQAVAGAQLKNLTFAGTILLTAQLVGGPEGTLSRLVSELNDTIKAAGDSITVDWAAIQNKQSHYPAQLHTHPIEELEGLDRIADSFADVAQALKNRRPTYASLQSVIEQQDRTIMLLGQFRKSLNSLIAVTGSAQQIVDVKKEVENIASRVDKRGSSLQGFSSTLGVWTLGSFSRITAMVIFNASGKTHSVQVDIASDGSSTQYTRSNEMFTQGSLFSLNVPESSGDIRLELTPTESGTHLVKWLTVI